MENKQPTKICFSEKDYRKLKRRSETLETIKPMVEEVKRSLDNIHRITRAVNQKNK
jgi:hypothetical protein